jgi:glycosyltransferase involved in cell wall biosynthesis
LHVYIVGLECQPERGSEPAIAWHWAAAYAALGHTVTIVTHESQREFADNRGRRVLFVDSRSSNWKPEPATTSRGLLRTSGEVIAWSRNVHRLLRILVEPDDLVHHVSWGTVRVQSPLADLPARTVWGPVGGGHLSPWAWALNPESGSLFEAVRNGSVLAVRGLSRLRQTAAGIGLVLATNDETAALASSAGASAVGLELADGLTELWSSERRDQLGSVIRLFWAGRVVRSKRLDLAVELVAELRRRGRAVSLTVAGDGPDLPRIRRLVESSGLSKAVHLLGWTRHARMPGLYRSADLYVFTSFRDSSFPAVLEAAAHGLPSVAVDHQGVRSLLQDDAAVKVSPTPLATMSSRMADAVVDLWAEPDRYRALASAARQAAVDQLWEAKARRVVAQLPVSLAPAGQGATSTAVAPQNEATIPAQRIPAAVSSSGAPAL